MRKKNNVRYSKCMTQFLREFNEFSKYSEDFKNYKFEARLMAYKMQMARGMQNYMIDNSEDNLDSRSLLSASLIADTIGSLIDADVKGYGQHIFIKDRVLYNALQNIKVKDVEGIKQYMKDFAEDFFFTHQKFDENNNLISCEDLSQKCLFYFIHFPIETNDEEGLSVRLRLDKEELICDYVKGCNCASFSSESKYLKNPIWESDKMDQKLWQLFLNVFFYMKAYPSCVSDGVPHGFRFEYPSIAKKVKLDINNAIVEKVNVNQGSNATHLVTPHFRKGHFRYLGSDYFKNKKGQFVFIEETMVRAQNAKTLNTLEVVKSK